MKSSIRFIHLDLLVLNKREKNEDHHKRVQFRKSRCFRSLFERFRCHLLICFKNKEMPIKFIEKGWKRWEVKESRIAKIRRSKIPLLSWDLIGVLT